MKKIEAYQCEFCNSIYADINQANECRTNCEKEEYKKKEAKKLEKNMKNLVNSVRLKAKSIEDVEKLILEVSAKIHGDAPISNVKLNVHYSEHCSASHEAPIGKPTSWGNSPNRKSYPGFAGKISYSHAIHTRNKNNPFEHINYFGKFGKKEIIGIHTGTGGARNEDGLTKGYYEVTLFLDDFPLIKERFEAEQEKAEIAKKYQRDLNKLFSEILANDPEIKRAKDVKQILNEQVNALHKLMKVEDEKIMLRHLAIKKPLEEQLAEKVKALNATCEYSCKGIAPMPSGIFG